MDPDYSVVAEDFTNGISVIRVTGCAVDTEVSIPAWCLGTEENSRAKYMAALYQYNACQVLDAMDPNSDNYDPSLVA